ncbi:hypothetical protein D3C72_601810 [compost metagenome]
MRAKGESFGAIATKLNSEGELTRAGRPFKAMTVKRISDRLQDPAATATPARKKRRHPLMEPIPAEVLALIPEAEHDVNRLRGLASSPSLDDQVRTAAEVYLKRYEAIAADPDRWVPSYIEESIDQVVAMSRFDATSADELLDFASSVPVTRQLRRQVYWAWMKNDARHLSASRRVHEPFMCDVGPRHVAQRSQYKLSSQDAAEFYSLAHFLPAYHRATGKTLSLIRKGFPEEQSGINEPDFIVRDHDTGDEVGIEMTDAIAGKRAMRDRFFWELVADLEDRLPGFEGTVTIADRQYDEKSDIRWEEVARNHREAFLNEIVTRVSGATRGKFRVSVAQDPGLKDILISFQRRKGRPFFFHTDQYGWCGDNPECIGHENLIQALRNKTENPAPYCTNRTMLVVYPINQVPTMGYDRVLAHARTEAQAVVAQSTRFQEVWVSKENGLWPLHASQVPSLTR